MITELTVSNYRSLGPEVRLSLGQLSFLVGPNGSGKSNILDVLTFVRDAVSQGLPAAITHRGGVDSVRRRSHGHPYNVKIALEFKSEEFVAGYSFEMTGDKVEEYRVKSELAHITRDGHHDKFERTADNWNGPAGLAPRINEQALALTSLGGDERFRPIFDYLRDLIVYSIFPDTLRAPQKFDSTRPMTRHGENWVSVLREMIKEDAEAKSDLVAGLQKLTGDIEDVKVSSAAGYLIAEFKQQQIGQGRKRWFDAGQQSDGTLRVAGLLTALLQSPTLPVIGVEEPELTVHPGALPMLYHYLRQASDLSQILVTTHSPIILDVVDLGHDSLIVVNRSNGMTGAQRVTHDQLEPVRMQLLSLGDLYLSGDLETSFIFPKGDEAK
ncbi:AAA family ATPase [Enhygromyxa salina]|uniref:Chromosome partition protein Smc n=1 Tax=Enhygromyxa salina TaxID=215803 RepID=A0A2S9YNP0_9BACT|nr:AAA family ATPase [Enhygromyxa salina]PRQ06711.1 Chromosome partition protein Smc [Enhygromyxa salina]